MKIIFYKGSVHKIIISISKHVNYISKIARKTNGMYSHIAKIIKALEEKEILTRKKEGRKVYIKLTKKGEKIKELLIELEKLTC